MTQPTRPDASLPAVLCAGRLYCDLVFAQTPSMPRLGAETFAKHLSLHAGGGAFITAASLAALGHRAGLMAVLPAPPFDQVVTDEIKTCGVTPAYVTPAGPCAPQITVAIAHDGDRGFLTHKTGPAMVPPDAVPAPWAHLHIGELRSLVEHPELLTLARAAGMTISLDCGCDDALLADGRTMAGFIEQVDIFLPNAQEFHKLRQSGLPEAAAAVVVVKDGANGARMLKDGTWLTASAQAALVVDTTGAGDAFDGGFLSGWLTGLSGANALARGNLCGAAAVSQPGGAAGLATLREVMA